MYRLISFTTIFPVATGLMLKATDTAGNRMLPQAIQTGALTRTDIGPTRITVGHGSATKTSAGPRITTVAGPVLRTTAGSGSPGRIWIGDRPGSHGEPVAITSAGRRCRHAVQALFMKGSRLVR